MAKKDQDKKTFSSRFTLCIDKLLMIDIQIIQFLKSVLTNSEKDKSTAMKSCGWTHEKIVQQWADWQSIKANHSADASLNFQVTKASKRTKKAVCKFHAENRNFHEYWLYFVSF